MVTIDPRYPDLAVKHIVVSGGASGIGRATVCALLSQRARVSVGDIAPIPAGSFGGDVDASVDATVVDVRRSEDVDAWLAHAVGRWGPVDGAILCAGIEPSDDASIENLEDSVWARIFDVNSSGTMRVARAVTRAMLAAGGDGRRRAITFVGSPTGFYGLEVGHHAYSASKAAVTGLARVMAVEMAPRNINVNIVWPGLIDTPMNEFIMRDASYLAAEVDRIPVGRVGEPAEVASVCMFLISEAARYCTGSVVCVDGGLVAR